MTQAQNSDNRVIKRALKVNDPYSADFTKVTPTLAAITDCTNHMTRLCWPKMRSKVAGGFLATLKKEKLVLDWRKRQQARASVRVAVEEKLDELPEAYDEDIYWAKVDAVYQHVYDHYFG